MKKKLILLVIVLCLLVVPARTVFASGTYLVDGAQLLTQSEAAALETKLARISHDQGVDIVVVTVDSTGGENIMDFADDFYDYNGYSTDGILLLISMDDHEWWVSTSGYGITAITDAGLDHMTDQFTAELSDGAYARAFDVFASLCDEFLTQAKTGDPYDRHNLPKVPFAFVKNLLIAVAVGVVAAWLATGTMKAKLKTVRQQATADDYTVPGSLQLSHSRDLLLYTHLDRREKPRSGGGSSVHTSSSGNTHGGGGGKF